MFNKSDLSLKKTVVLPRPGSPDFNDMNSSELGQWIAKTPLQEVLDDFAIVKSHESFLDSLTDLPEATLSHILKNLEEEDLIKVLNQADLDDTTYFLETLGDEATESLFPKLSRSQKLRQYLDYPKDSCGRAMQTDFFTLPIELSAKEALKHIRSKAGESQIYYLYCLTTKGKLIGVVSLRELATCDENTPLDELVKREVLSVQPTEDIKEAIIVVKREDFVALPVATDKGRMIGIISVDDVLDEIEEQATADIYASAGLQQMDSVNMKGHLSYMNRAPWLIFNLFLACVASFVISLFESTLEHYTILAILMPIAAALGGNTAVQTLTIVTRGLATGDFNYISYSKAIVKEILVGVCLGLTTGFVAFLIVYSWQGNLIVGASLGVSMAINSFVAATLGASIPIIIKSLGKDPAVGSGVLVITLTDIFCFFSFLGISSWVLNQSLNF